MLEKNPSQVHLMGWRIWPDDEVAVKIWRTGSGHSDINLPPAISFHTNSQDLQAESSRWTGVGV